jgi:hypothetical protein
VVLERHFAREMIVHGVAFCVAAAIGAAILLRYYAIFEHDTDSVGAAREAFLMAVGITGGIGPAVTLTAFWLVRMIRRSEK